MAEAWRWTDQNMNEAFRQHVEQLHAKYEALLRMSPVTLARLPKDVPNSGIYLFSEGGSHLYVGRSKGMRARLRYHCSSAQDAPFAFKLAREQTGNLKATYSSKGSRGELLADPGFVRRFKPLKNGFARWGSGLSKSQMPSGRLSWKFT